MADNHFKVNRGLSLVPQSGAPSNPTNGDIYYDSGLNKFRKYENGAFSDLASSSEVLDTVFKIDDAVDPTKQIDFNAGGTTGTKTTITAAQTANRVFTLPDATTTALGHDTAQVITNKDIDGGTASNTRRLTLPQDTFANISALTRKEGTILYGTDTDTVYYDDGTTLTAIGSGSGGGINYISNGTAESATTGWATYADAAGALPVDGTGGSPSITFTRSTSSPLRGTASFLFTKGATNRQGDGASYAFTIDSADQGKQLAVDMDIVVASGTYADGDLAVYLYDVTNSQVIQPANFSILNQVVGLPQRKVATFQTSSNSTSYRLIFHVASTSAVAYTVKFDRVTVGPQFISTGPALSDWRNDRTFTPSAGFGTPTLSSIFYRRVGDAMQVRGSWKNGSNTASTAFITLPAGIIVDVNKISAQTNLQAVGRWEVERSGSAIITSQNEGVMFYDGSTTNQIFFAYRSGSTQWTKENSDQFSNSSDGMSFEFTIPVAGWASNSVVSSEAETRLVSAQAVLNANTSFTGNTVIKFDTSVYDTHAQYSTSTGLYTAPVGGKYEVKGCTLNAGGAAGLYVVVNGTAKTYIGASSTSTGAFAGTVTVNAGDTIGIYTDTTRTYTGGSANGAFLTNITFTRISGPQQISESETVAAAYYLSANASPGADAVLKFDTKFFDTHGAYSTSTGLFTAPAPGFYRFATIGQTTATGQAGVYLVKNGSATVYAGVYPLSAEGAGMATLQLLAGDQVAFFIDSNRTINGGTGSGARFTHMSVERIK